MTWLVQFLVGNALIATVLGLAATLAMRWRRPALAHALWLLVMLKLLTPPMVRLAVPWPVTVSQAIPIEQKASPSPAVAEEGRGEGPGISNLKSQIEQSPHPNPLPPRRTRGPEVVQPSKSHWNLATIIPSPFALIVSGWLIGTTAWLAFVLLRIRRFSKLIDPQIEIPRDLRVRVDHLRRKLNLRQTPMICLIPANISPMLYFLGGEPKLLLPSQLLNDLSDEQRDALLLHELAHLKRGDHLCRVLELIATGVFWWHPLLWWARRGLHESEEQCCDAWVIWAMPQSARSYADALVDTLDFLAASPLNLAPCASGVGGLHNLQRRLTMIFSNTPDRSMSIGGRLLVLALLGALPLMPVVAQQQTPVPGQRVASTPNVDPAAPTTQSVVQALLEAAGDPDRNVRDSACVAIVGMGQDAVPAVINAAGDEKPLVRASSLRILSLMVNDPNGNVRRVWMSRAAGGGSGSQSSTIRSGTWTTNNPILSDRQVNSAISAELRAKIAPVAVKGASDSDPQVRQAAADLLGRLFDQSDAAAPALIKLLDDKDVQTSSNAIRSLTMMAGTRSNASLASAVPALIRCLKHEDQSVRKFSAELLGQIGAEAHSAVPDLIQALIKDPVSEVRSAAARAIGQIQAPAREAANLENFPNTATLRDLGRFDEAIVGSKP